MGSEKGLGGLDMGRRVMGQSWGEEKNVLLRSQQVLFCGWGHSLKISKLGSFMTLLVLERLTWHGLEAASERGRRETKGPGRNGCDCPSGTCGPGGGKSGHREKSVTCMTQDQGVSACEY